MFVCLWLFDIGDILVFLSFSPLFFSFLSFSVVVFCLLPEKESNGLAVLFYFLINHHKSENLDWTLINFMPALHHSRSGRIILLKLFC